MSKEPAKLQAPDDAQEFEAWLRDMMIYGCVWDKVMPDGTIKHVPMADVLIDPKDWPHEVDETEKPR
jgi:hypothetical protein